MVRDRIAMGQGRNEKGEQWDRVAMGRGNNGTGV